MRRPAAYHRPFSPVAEMDQVMIERSNSVVESGDQDEVWHLGDFAVRQSTECLAFLLDNLNGRSTGNNDDGCGHRLRRIGGSHTLN